MASTSAAAFHALASSLTPAPARFHWINNLLSPVSNAAGLPLDQLRVVVCLFLAYPLAAGYRLLPTAKLKHWTNVCVGILMAQFVYGEAWVHSFFSALGTYAIVRWGPVEYAPYIAFVLNMAFLAALHIHRMWVDYMGWTMDSTGSQMLLVIKLTSFAFNWYDGQACHRIQSSDSESPQRARVQKMRDSLAITEMPGPLEFLGYVYSFTTFLAGPSFEFREYIDAVEGRRYVVNGQRQMPPVLKPLLTKLMTGLFFIALLFVFGSHGNLHQVVNEDQFWMTKAARIYAALFLTRSRYYCAWKLAEGATILTGAGFEGYDEKGRVKGWDGVSNVDIIGFELGQSIRDLSRAWNKGTQLWLERYVYTRTGNSLLATYLCSAIWHGFYPGYYIFFLTIPLATSVNRLSRKHIRPYFVKQDGTFSRLKPLYDATGLVATALIINYLAVSFVALSWERSIIGFRNMHYAGHICLVLLYLLLSAVPVKKVVKKV